MLKFDLSDIIEKFGKSHVIDHLDMMVNPNVAEETVVTAILKEILKTLRDNESQGE